MSDFLNDAGELLKSGSLLSWLFALVLAVTLTGLARTALKGITARIRKFAERTEAKWDDIAVACLGSTRSWALFVWLFYSLIRVMNISYGLSQFAHIIVIGATLVQVAIWGLTGLRLWRENFLKAKIETDVSAAAAIGLLYGGLQAMFLVALALVGLSNLGIDIGALLAGLGVGGIAVALAAQNILGDLLASLSIVLDKPFVIGDSIEVGSDSGTVEHIGIKTTRLRSVSGEELVFSNKYLLDNRIRNFKRMWQRRAVQKFGVTYSTSSEKLAKIPEWVKACVTAQAKVSFERCHLVQYGGSSLDYELVFWVSDPDYNTFVAIQERLLLDIFRKFNEERVGFAFPTQSLYVENWPQPHA